MRKAFKSFTYNPNYGIFPISLPPHHPRQLARVYFDLSLNKNLLGRVVFQLCENLVPKTTQNFLKFATGFKHIDGQVYGYKNTEFTRILPMRGIWGGDVSKGKSISIYGGKFADESFVVKHNSQGILTTCNIGGPNGNDSRFIITLGDGQWLDRKSVAFGEVIYGYNVLQDIEKLGTMQGKPDQKVIISDCGQVSHQEYDQYTPYEHFDVWASHSHH